MDTEISGREEVLSLTNSESEGTKLYWFGIPDIPREWTKSGPEVSLMQIFEDINLMGLLQPGYEITRHRDSQRHVGGAMDGVVS